LQIVRDGMRQSVTSGVARNAATANVAVAGKTGTAEFGTIRVDGKYDTHGWFVGFAPYDDPQIAVMVFVQKGSGGNDASPAAGRIFDYYFNGIDPTGPRDPVPPVPQPTEPGANGEPEPTPVAIPTPFPNSGFEPAPAPIEPETPGPTPAPTAEATPPPETPPPETPAPETPAPEPTPPPETPDPAAAAEATPAGRRLERMLEAAT
jgi:membrane peptidoglycan carboxypeptidase